MGEIEFRSTLRETTYRLCGGETGVTRLSPTALEVTEGRAKEKNAKGDFAVSTCGELIHCAQKAMRIRNKWVNRESLKGTVMGDGSKHPGFRWNANNPGKWDNMSLIYQHPRFVGGALKGPVKDGTVLYVQGAFQHVALVFEHVPELEHCNVGHYGQSMSTVGADGKWVYGHKLSLTHFGNSIILGRLDLWEAYKHALSQGDAENVYA